MKKELAPLIGKPIVVDTCSNWIYIGTLDHVTEACIVLKEVDAHDIGDTKVSKEFYVFDSKTTGIKANRREVSVSLAFVVGFSSLEDIKEF